MTSTSIRIPKTQAREIWLHAQRLDTATPFGAGLEATPAAVRHLGYVQIDTINVIERSHHHILYTRIPDYERDHLRRAQSIDKTVLETWTHALAYISTQDLPHFLRDMRRNGRARGGWMGKVTTAELRKVLSRIRREGPLTLRDINDDVLVEKDHAWGSRKPSRRALQLAFYSGVVTISERSGMLKRYELMTRHFGWDRQPRAATVAATNDYLLDRALRSQGIVSLDSVCFMDAPRKKAMQRLIDARARRGALVALHLAGADKLQHWALPETLDSNHHANGTPTHILSPFDPLITQRRRLALFFDYAHRFEAYVPKDKRVFGYFVCPVLSDGQIVAGLDLKTDRARERLKIQKWSWFGKAKSAARKAAIESALHRFERFQLAR